jgi:hypothetical protein
MNGGFAFRAAAVCVGAGAVAGVVAAPAGPAAVAWVLAGWAATAVAGYCSGTRLVALRGRVGSAFVVALGTSMLVRLAAAAIGTAAAAWAGPAAVGPWLLGLATGYAPLQAYEIVWFYRRATVRA